MVVEDALHAWWSAALRSLQSGGDTSACTIGHDRYVALCMNIYRQLVPGRVTSSTYQSEARCQAEKDWVHDSKGRNELGRADLLDGLFELADLYVPTVSADDYALFLGDLLSHVSIAPAEGPPLLWREKPMKPTATRNAAAAFAASSGALAPPASPKSPQQLQSPPRTPKTPSKRAQLRVMHPVGSSPGLGGKRPLTPGTPLTPNRKPPRTLSSGRELHPSSGRWSLEREWLASSVGLPPHVLTPSPTKRVLPAIGSTASLAPLPAGSEASV